MRWRVFSSGKFLGTTVAPTDAAATSRARLFWDQRPLQVVSEVAWATFNAKTRAIFETGAVPDPKGEVCRKCKKPVPQVPPRGKRSGRPRRIHDECLSPGARRWRYDPRRHENQQRYREERKEQMEGVA